MTGATRHERPLIYADALAVIDVQFRDAGLGLDEVAAEIGSSRRSVQRAFAEAGTTFRRQLAARRMREAIALLERGELVRDAGRQVGYPHAAQFCKAFKRVVGVPPSEWRDGRRP